MTTPKDTLSKYPTAPGGACLAIAVALALHSHVVQAQSGQLDEEAERTNVSIVVGAGSSDNIRRVGTNSESGSYRLAGVLLDVVRARPRLNVELGDDIEFRDYSNTTLGSERVGVVDGSVEVLAVPERFSWLLAGRSGQGRTDPFGVESPENREDIDIFETGPRLRFPVGQRTDIRLAATAGTRAFETTNTLDSDTTEIEAGLHRAISATTEFGVVLSSREVEYDLSQFNNEVDRAYVTYARQLASGRAAFGIGTNRADFGSGSESSPYVTLEWERQVGARSVFSATLRNEFVDSADNIDYDRLVVYDAGAGTLDGNVLLSQDVAESTSLFSSLTIGGTRTRFTIGAGLSESRYRTDLGLDNDSLRLNVTAARELSTRTELGFTADLARRDYKNAAQEDKDSLAELWLQRSFAGPFSARLGYRRNSRSGVGTVGYDENTVTLGLQYDIGSDGS